MPDRSGGSDGRYARVGIHPNNRWVVDYLSLRPREGYVRGVSAGSNAGDRIHRTHVRSVKGIPGAAVRSVEEGLKDGVEVLRAQCVRVFMGDLKIWRAAIG